MQFFKKKKSAKTVIDQLNEQIAKLPTAQRVQSLVTEASKKTDRSRGSMDDSSSPTPPKKSHGIALRRLQSFKTTAPVSTHNQHADEVTSVRFRMDCVIGLEQGLQQEEIVALDIVEKKLDFLTSSLDNTEKEDDINILVRHSIETDLMANLLTHQAAMSFKSRQSVTSLICGIIERAIVTPELRSLLFNYMEQHQTRIISKLLKNYSNPIIFLYTGAIFRSCLKCDAIYLGCLDNKFALFDEFFNKFLKFESFENVSDAFNTFREILQGKKTIVCDYLDEHYDKFFPKYNELLKSSEYIAQRQSLKLLSDLLLVKQSKKVMLRYIGETENLVLIMNLMRVTSQSMRLEAFHVFKIFVANPNKTEGITNILSRNREKLVKYLSNLTGETDEGLFKDEKNLIIRTLQSLPPVGQTEQP